MDGDIDTIESIDKKNVFTMENLQNTITAIIKKELQEKNNAVFYIMDSGPRKTMAHSDHFVTGTLAWRGLTSMHITHCKALAFEDYRTKTKSINLDEAIAEKKNLLFNAYDVFMMAAHQECTICNRVHFEWLFRSYYRAFSC